MSTCKTTLDIVSDEAGFLALEPHWEALHESSAVRTPFRTWDWSRLWWKHFRDVSKLRIGALRDASGVPVAIAPFVLSRDRSGPRRHLRHLTFLGGLGEVVSEGLDFFVQEGREQELLPRFAPMFDILRREWDVIDVPMLHAESPTIPVIRDLIETAGISGDRSDAMPDQVLALSSTWDEQLTTFSRNRRNDIRSKWKKMIELHQGRPLVGSQDLTAEEAMDHLIALHRLRFTEAESTFISPVALAFHRELVQMWMPKGRVLITLLEADGRMAAGRYGFVFDGRYWDYQSGYDDDFAAISVGNLNLAWAVQNTIRLGLMEYDHLAGSQPYKVAWSTRTRHLLHLKAFSQRSTRAMLFHFSRGIKRRIARIEPGTPSVAASFLSDLEPLSV